MSSPVVPRENNNINTNQIPERLQNILDALSEYHKYILMKASHYSQSPQELLALETLLRQKAKEIINFLLYKKIPQDADDELKKCLESLRDANTPWNPEVSTLSEYWCKMMFIEHPFVLNHNHINSLLQNSQYNTEDEEYNDEESQA